ncbi:outer membrane usher protein [Faunimonas pinastri]|uniref:Outer membrane usher protein n=1 Tax=Faunimonas pinastri TaxID=1855383 RepID=A0A1H9B6Y4_9HYPH|nr:spore coat U domain-containing protein [Faunimonas pinastri]SEP84008.1 outer membrane usher protein [Faunimonas pinastri]
MRRSVSKIAYIGACACVLSWSAQAATTAQSNLHVHMTVEESCTVGDADLDFGSVHDLSSERNAQATIAVNCANTGAYTIALDPGQGAGAAVTQRYMKLGGTDGAHQVSYGLFSDASRSAVWGDGTGSSQMMSGAGTSSFTVYGQVPAQSLPALGSYSDTVTISVAY